LAGRAINNYIESNLDFELRSQVISFKGNPEYMLVYSYSDGVSMKVISMDLGILKGEKVYVISYSAEPKQYDNYMPTILNMINSFQITFV